MKISKLKYLFLGITLLFAVPTFGQLYIKYPSHVRLVGGGYNNSRPHFKTLEAALNDVKSLATAQNPYTFWIMSDSLYIADWDSIFTASGLTMKDSIDNYYVATGKIKWAGFGQGGGGSGGGTSIPIQTETTAHYDYPNWDQNSGILSQWIQYLAQGIDSIDQHIYDLIVYTGANLTIENDTLKIDLTNLTSDLDLATRPDTTIISYKSADETLSGDKTMSGDNQVTGSWRLPTANNNPAVSRIIWSASNRPYWSGSGAVGDSLQFVMKKTGDSDLELDTLISWTNIKPAVKDSIHNPSLLTIPSDSTGLEAGKIWYNATTGAIHRKFQE